MQNNKRPTAKYSAKPAGADYTGIKDNSLSYFQHCETFSFFILLLMIIRINPQ